MSMRLASRIAECLVGLGISVLPMHAYAGSSTFEADIDRLQELLQVREAAEGISAQLLSTPQFKALGAMERSCVLRVAGPEAVFAEERAYNRMMYADADVLAATLAFHQRPVGRKVSMMVNAGPLSINEVRAGLEPREVVEFDQFLGTPAGQLMKQVPRQTPRVGSEVAHRLAEVARRECGTEQVRILDGEIERLLAVYHVREKAQRTISKFTSGPAFEARPIAEQACLRLALTVDPLVGEERVNFRTVFAEPDQRKAILSYFESEGGRILNDRLWADEVSGRQSDPLEDMSASSRAELTQFINSPAGQAFFQEFPPRLGALRKATVDKLARRAVAECES